MNILQTPIKSPNDKKSYRVIELPNGLKALLISDPKDSTSCNSHNVGCDGDSGHVSIDETVDSEDNSDNETMEEESGETADEDNDENDSGGEGDANRGPREKMAAAALCINVGSFSDPKELQGLAHYLEHMVFMGSEKYPDENSFSAFMKKRSGTDNAFTDCERTVFKLEIHPKHFYEALDRLAQFFIAPLMKKDSMDRELEAVDSEFNLSVSKDYCRRLLLFGSLSKEGSPMTQFMWGNSKTLKVEPEENGIDVYTRLREFWSRHYSAQFMTLTVQSTESLDTLQQWVTEHFSSVPNNQLSSPSFEEHKEPFKTQTFHKLYKLCPVKKTNEVFVQWSLPSQQHNYKCKPLHYLSHVIGDEGRGSLLALLRKKAWALSLECGNDESGTDHNSIHASFMIKIGLTDSGMDNIQKVLNLVFQYIDLVKREGPQKRIFEEMKTIMNNHFTFQEETEAIDYVESLCEYMQLYPPENYIIGSKLCLEYDADAIDFCTQLLMPESANFMIMSTRYSSDPSCNLREKWTQMIYSVEDIPENWMNTWKTLPPHSSFHLPLPNSYIATDFELKNDSSENTEFPTKIFENDFCRLYFKKDHKFNVPKACMYFRLLSNLTFSSAKNEALTDLLMDVLDQRLSVEAYPARAAFLSYQVYRDDEAIVIKINGFDHKLPTLLETILQHLAEFDSEPEVFDAVKKQLMKNYYNRFISPGTLCRETRFSLLLDPYWAPIDKRAALPEINLPMLQTFSKELFKNIFVEGLIQGNVLPQEAIGLIQLVYSKLKCSPLPKDLIPEIRVVQFPVANTCLRVPSFNTEDTNSVVTNYYQYGPTDIRHKAILELFCEMMEEPTFDTLRTKEQLGYYVGAMQNVGYGITGFSIIVHASGDKFSCSHVDNRIECFLNHFMKTMEDLTKEEFDIQVLSLIRLKQCVDLKLTEEVHRNWGEITSFEYVFDRREQEVSYLEALTLEEFKSWMVKEIAGERRKLSMQVVGCGCISKDDCECFPNIPISSEENEVNSQPFTLNFLQPKEKNEEAQFLYDIKSFKEKLPLYPVSRICN